MLSMAQHLSEYTKVAEITSLPHSIPRDLYSETLYC